MAGDSPTGWWGGPQRANWSSRRPGGQRGSRRDRPAPWGLDFLPDGSALVTERNSGRVLRVRRGSAPQQVAQISGVVAAGEAGLLGLAVSPRYRTDGFVYVYFTSDTDNRIVRFRLTAPQVQQPVLTGLARSGAHNGGRIAFGPDGLLYAGVGDAGQPATAQDPSHRNGKILRMLRRRADQLVLQLPGVPATCRHPVTGRACRWRRARSRADARMGSWARGNCTGESPNRT
ncbi:PQQ-dependent sugar dehydrogenase [Micromonospora sp. NPDC052213]|uniref:PQQ-dependent sugar dehydrogenase n=1 Tax=Micromonospora sp. NPDC052213 TaxID=3155812 RepID=UPI00343BA9D7